MNSNATQNQRILRLLRTKGDDGLTSLEALHIVGSLRLGARIFDLRDRRNGYLHDDEDIETERVTQTTGDGTSKTFARYVLRPRRVSSNVVNQTTFDW